MAKVMISIPDVLLERIDTHAKATGESRSGLLQRLAERELDLASDEMKQEVRRLLDEIGPLDLGGDAAKLIREDRESH